MADQDLNQSRSTNGFADVMSSAVNLLRSAERSNPHVRKAVETLQQAATAAKAEDHDGAMELLSSGLALPVREIVRAELPRLLRRSIRQAIGDGFPQLVSDALRERLSTDVVEQLCQDVLSGRIQDGKDLAESVGQLKDAIESQTTVISRLTEAGVEEAILSIAAPGFVARIRDQAPVKSEIGRRVAEVFFTEQRRPTFVLASSTAVHLGLQLRRLPTVIGTLLYTNSVAFPLAALNDCSPHEVASFWGRNYDDRCGGWLPVIGDEHFYSALRNCFSPGSYGLTTAVVTPRKLSIEHGLHFVRPETAKMARCLIESAEDTIVMLPADRICTSLEVSEQSSAFPSGANWRRLGKRIHIVAAGTAANCGDWTHRLAEQGLAVHYLPPESSVWQAIPPQ